MAQIGRKIYYISNGNVVLDIKECEGSVAETTIDQDFQFYVALQPYLKSAVGVIKCDYGYATDNFSKYPFHIDITKNPIDETAIVWDTANPLGATLAQVQQAKISQIDDFYSKALAAGFLSSASGTSITYGYRDSEQQTFDDLSTMDLRGWVTYPINVYAQDGTTVNITSKTQLDQLFKDIFNFKYPLKTKQHAYINQVNACATIDDVNKIIVTF